MSHEHTRRPPSPDFSPRHEAQTFSRPQTPADAHRPASQPEGPLHFNLTLPVTRVGFGIFTVDPLTQLLGRPLTEILSPLMTGPMVQRFSPGGLPVDVYPLALPPGQGASIRLGAWGDIGLQNDRGFLKLIVPWMMAGWMQQRLSHCLVRGPVQALSLDRTAFVAETWVQLHPGARATLPLASFGEIGVEVG